MQEEAVSIGNYKLLKKIGEGSYGVVYKALEPLSDKVVALKKIKIDASEDGIPTHCIREIGILKKVCHPNIVKLLDVMHFPAEHRLVLVFEHVDRCLSQMLDDKPSSPINPYLCKVAAALLEPHAPAHEGPPLPPLQPSSPPRHQARQHPSPQPNRYAQAG